MGSKRLSVAGICDHTSVLVEDKLIIWGGYRSGLVMSHDSDKKRKLTSSVDTLDVLNFKPQVRLTSGTPPNGVMGYSSCCVDDDIYYFGGSCLLNDCYHNNLFVLNTTNVYKWRQIQCYGEEPTKKANCGMIPFTEDGDRYILVIGGCGQISTHDIDPTISLGRFGDRLYFTNEIHIMCLSNSLGKWTVPNKSGDAFPPSSGFSINIISGNRAILFGGLTENEICSNLVYILTYTKNSVVFRKMSRPPGGGMFDGVSPWPRIRFNHSSVVISSLNGGVKKHYLLILGGEDMQTYMHQSMYDCWIFDIKEHQWTQVLLDTSSRSGHCANSFKISENRVWLIVTGGRLSQSQLVTGSPAIMIVELVHSHGHWAISDYIKYENTSTFKEYVAMSLMRARTEQETSSIERDQHEHSQQQILMERDQEISIKGERISGLTKELNNEKEIVEKLSDTISKQDEAIQQRDKTIEQKDETIQQKEETIQLTIEQKDEKIKGLEKEKEFQNQLADMRMDLLKAELQRSAYDVMKYKNDAEEKEKLLKSRPWIFEEKELKMTDTRIGNGAYGEVRVAIFRGVKVAAKTLHAAIAGPHNKKLFEKEMELCASLNHPNIVQFIGCVGDIHKPTLLYELMATSLYSVLHDHETTPTSLTRPQIIGIASDICSAMCYLHQWRPQPLVHKDISSPNVLMEPLPDDRWRAKLSDFGSASIHTEAPGNSCYSAPEAKNPSDHTPAMDVYSFGVLLTEMTVHRVPDSVSDKRAVLAHSIEWIEMRDIVLQCINDDHSQRLTSEQLLTQLQALVVPTISLHHNVAPSDQPSTA